MTREAINASQLHELLGDSLFLTRLAHVAFQAHNGTEAGFSVSRYTSDNAVYSTTLMPESPGDNGGFDPEHVLDIGDFHRQYAAPLGPLWAMLIHGHPGNRVPNHDPRQCPSLNDLKLHNYINQRHPGHIGGILTTTQLPFVFRLFLYRSGPQGINLDELETTYQTNDPEECVAMLGRAGLRTARILYQAESFRWLGKPEKLFEL